MMSAEEDIDISEELNAMSFSASNNLMASPASLSSNHSTSQPSSLTLSEGHAENVDVQGGVTSDEKLESSIQAQPGSQRLMALNAVPSKEIQSKSVTTEAELNSPATANASSLFGNKTDDSFLGSSKSSKYSSQNTSALFAGEGNTDFLTSSTSFSKISSPMSSFDMMNKDSNSVSSSFNLTSQPNQAHPLNNTAINNSFQTITSANHNVDNFKTSQFQMSAGLSSKEPQFTADMAQVSPNNANVNVLSSFPNAHVSQNFANNTYMNQQNQNSDIDSHSSIPTTAISSPRIFTPSVQNNIPGQQSQNFLSSVPQTNSITNGSSLVTQTNLYQNSASNLPSSSGLYIPSMYGRGSDEMKDPPKFFVPSAPVESSAANFQSFSNNVLNTMPVNSSGQPYFEAQQQYQQQASQLPQAAYYTQQHNNQPHLYQSGVDDQGKGIWHWIKNTVNQDWSEGAQNIKKQLKNATDSVLTTLDPGMEEYLKPVINVGTDSQNVPVLFGIKEGFSNAHGTAIVKGQLLSNNQFPLLPVGFESVMKVTNHALDTLSTVNFDFQGDYVVASAKVFVTELVSNQWSAMICVGLKDVRRNLSLYSYSQAIPLPAECVTIAYNRSSQQQTDECFGYDISIEEAVRLHIPYTKEQDWCSVLTGIPLRKIVGIASQCLARDYNRKVDSMPAMLAPDYSSNNLNTYSDNSRYSQQYAVNTSQTSQQDGAVVFNGF